MRQWIVSKDGLFSFPMEVILSFLPLGSLNFFHGYTLNTVLLPTASASLIPAEMGEFMPVYTALCAVLFRGFVQFFGFNCSLSAVFQGDLAHYFPESAE